jgi:hypothetical protein
MQRSNTISFDSVILVIGQLLLVDIYANLLETDFIYLFQTCSLCPLYCVCDNNKALFQTTCPQCLPVASLIDNSCAVDMIVGPNTTPCGQTGTPVGIFCTQSVVIMLADGTVRCQDAGNTPVLRQDELIIQCQSNGQYLATIAPSMASFPTNGPCNPTVGGPPVAIAGAMSIRCLTSAMLLCTTATFCAAGAAGCWLYAMNWNKVCIVVQPGSLCKQQKPGNMPIVILTCILSRVVNSKQIPVLILGIRFSIHCLDSGILFQCQPTAICIPP